MADSVLKYPHADSKSRLEQYQHYTRLFDGDHFDAFSIKVDDPKFSKYYAQLRYISINFAGLISKVIADFLFSESPTYKATDGDQEYVEGLVKENNLNVQNYESALGNSYLGDAVYKIRIGKRNSMDEKSSVIIEDINPAIYFPHIDPFNVRAKPEVEELSWMFEHATKKYVRQELHSPGMIEYHMWELQAEKLIRELTPDQVKDELGINGWITSEETGIDRNLIVHIPNWKTGKDYFGKSDYFDLESIFYAINNRMTMTDNILDKHSDPILAVPEGVLDEDGKVNKEKLGMIEIPDGLNGKEGKPEYIVWNASLDNAFKEVEQLTEYMFMISETSPDILGMGKGKSDSGRALKLKLLRTIAKASRKKLYYDAGLKEVLYIAQLMAKKWGVKIDGKALQGEPVYPEIIWKDGLPIDEREQIENEALRINSELTSRKDSIVRIDGIDEEMAEAKVKEIDAENQIDVVKADATPDIEPKDK